MVTWIKVEPETRFLLLSPHRDTAQQPRLETGNYTITRSNCERNHILLANFGNVMATNKNENPEVVVSLQLVN
jgi:hypothetical protein